MIIRRISKGIKDQDWFVVMVEILIVVVGIFIGLQVDDWNEERKEKVLLSQYLERLDLEFEGVELFLEKYIEGVDFTTGLLTGYHDNIVDKNSKSQNNSALLGQLCRNGIAASLEFDTPVLDEMITTGYVRLVHDQSFQNALQDFQSVRRTSIVQTNRQAPALLDAYTKIKPYRRLKPLQNFENLGDCSFDFTGFETNNNASSWVADVQRIEMFYSRSAFEILNKLKEAKGVLKKLTVSGEGI